MALESNNKGQVNAYRFNPSFTGNAAMALRHFSYILVASVRFNPSFTGNAAMA